MHFDWASHFFLIIKIAGAVSTVSGSCYGFFHWVLRPVKKIMETNDTVSLLAANHIPHIEQAIEAHTTALQGLKSDMRSADVKVDGLCNRVDDLKGAVHTLGESFIQHLENASQERVSKRKRIK